MKPGYTYIMGSLTGTLYIGVTSDLEARVWKHKNGTFEGFSKKYNCTRLLYYEQHEDIRISIGREKQLKGWRREKKLALIRTSNPEFKDLAAIWGWKFITGHQRISDN
ncbi:MAG TPA: GIY-YIG nuclease family protein [Bryocella sp.]|nr:GIY-YIG nuclease family protein [Bryocella sp.]